MRRYLPLVFVLAACNNAPSGGDAPPSQTPPDEEPIPVGNNPVTFTFESGPVRPLALSRDGSRIFVTNLPDGYLEIYRATDSGVTHESAVAVGVDPVAVAVRNDSEVWVVNHISDSVSIVDVSQTPPRVTRTLLVGDEPRDIVFAGGRAFVTTAHRGQQRSSPDLAGVPGAGDPQLTTPSIGRADVWVFDAETLGDSAGGRPVAIVTLPGDTPRALAVTPDGTTVLAAIFRSGNRSTVTSAGLSCEGFDDDTECVVEGNTLPGAQIGPATNHAGVEAPRVGAILKLDNSGKWRDIQGRDWTSVVRFTLPDRDLFAIDAATLTTKGSFAGVGTTLFNIAVNPVTGALYTSNTEARNELRFEGPGTYAGTTLQGHLAESRITVIKDGDVLPRHLNKHISYDVLPAPAGVKEHSLATPLEMAVSGDGATLYVAAFGSSKVGVFSSTAIEDDSFDPTTTTHVTVSGGGPAGLVLDEARGRLYVTTRFDNGVSVVDVASNVETSHVTMHDTEPSSVRSGRHIMYDATLSSANGEAACGSCHIFGDHDALAWDLGDPDGDVVDTPMVVKLGVGAPTDINGTGDISELHPMKGPMGTQTLRGMVNHGAMHWRGDRVDGFYGRDTRTSPPFDSELAFKNFIVAFNGLLGRAEQLDDATMQAFADFTLAMVMPPNPIRSLDNQLNAAEARGKRYFMGCDGLDSVTAKAMSCDSDRPAPGTGHFADGVPIANFGFTCEGCHVLQPENGFFGTDGKMSFEALPQTMKIPQLRNLYDRVGMFGNAATPFEHAGDNEDQGPQIRGFGFLNDGSIDTVFRFFRGFVFDPAFQNRVGFFGGDPQRRDVEAFMMAFDTDLPPIVGQQVTLTSANAASAGARVDLLIARGLAPFVSKLVGANSTECDVVARLVVAGEPRAYRMLSDGTFEPDNGAAVVTDAELRALASMPGQELTYTCLPPHWGSLAVDRDSDGVKNGMDACADDASCF